MLKGVNLILVFIAATSVTMKWVDEARSRVKIFAEPGKDSDLRRCVEGGLSVEFRYEVKLCKKRLFWFDSCEKEYIETRTVSKEPIVGQYRTERDVFGDESPPETRTVKSLDYGFNEITSIDIPLETLTKDKDGLKFKKGKRGYISVRVVSSCKGEVNPVLRRLSQFLTFGLVDIKGSDSGWINFYPSS